MTFSKTLICLANSVRNQKHCVAGKEWTAAGPGKWIRPIHSEADQEISTADQTYQNRKHPIPGDLFKLTIERPYPDGNQTENHIIDRSKIWEAAGRASWSEIEACIDADVDMIWTVGDSSDLGENDKILARDRRQIDSSMPIRLTQTPTICREILPIARRDILHVVGVCLNRIGTDSSLMLVRPANFVLHVAKEYNSFDGTNKWRGRARFGFNGVTYRFVVTDPVMWSRYVHKRQEADYELQDVVLCISMMGTSIDQNTTKLVAAVLERKNFE